MDSEALTPGDGSTIIKVSHRRARKDYSQYGKKQRGVQD